ncbi:helix-turn-helix domain-containing protein [Nannocystis pusilla]|uniref:Helix-turn-helix domain-containing protein n=1 Tax=Nannocystis pusilla TaxID=889268 RepID=A0ABS7TI50_9BACT|nr:helix-turn-helix domain-containing protein [Nannocystis pusilla]
MLRAKLVLLAAEGHSNQEIARRLGCHVDTVRVWRGRFARDGRVVTLEDRPRSGRPPRVSPVTRCKLIKLACDKPARRPAEPFDVDICDVGDAPAS